MNNDFNMNMTFAEVLHKIEVLRTELANEISQLKVTVEAASQVLRTAELSYLSSETEANLDTLNDAEGKYWVLQDKLDDVMLKHYRFEEAHDLFRNVPDCRNLHQLTYALSVD